MKLKNLKLENFRSFEYLEIDFDEKLTVLVGNNGAGKTSILDGLALLLGAYLRRLPEVKGIGPSRSDIRMLGASKKLAPAFRCVLEANTSHEGRVVGNTDLLPSSIQWSVSLTRDQTPKTRQDAESMQLKSVGFKELNQFVDQLIGFEELGFVYELPVVAYYATDRAVFSMPIRRRGFKKFFSRFDALKDALQPATNFKRLIEWMHAKENDELRQQRAEKSFDTEDAELEVVRRAITRFFPDFKKPRTELRPLRFLVDWVKDGQSVPFDLDQLSDGYRTTLALVADLASRMAEANPPRDLPQGGKTDPLESQAVVLIDEVDLHLHPQWQSKIVHQLRAVFPNTQFIVATHSPLVIRHMHDGVVYRLNRNGQAERVNVRAPGALADLFNDVFGVNVNQLADELLDGEQHRKAKQNLKALLLAEGGAK